MRYIILYSTETGRAKACARRTSRVLRSAGSIKLDQQPCSFDDLGPERFFALTAAGGGVTEHDRNVTLICFVSTAGDGEHTSTIQSIWPLLLRKKLDGKTFEGLKVALFCLGDRCYGDLFCAAGRKFGLRMVQLGAEMICKMGYGDDDGDLFRDLDSWIEGDLLQVLRLARANDRVEVEEGVENKYEVDFLEEPMQVEEGYESFSPALAYSFTTIMGKIISNERITNIEWKQDVRHIKILVPSSVSYKAGDVAAILPQNYCKAEITKFISFLSPKLQSRLHERIRIHSHDHDSSCNNYWPKITTLFSLITNFFDIHSIPEREDFYELSKMAQNPDQSMKLLEMSQSVGNALYVDYAIRNKRTWVDVLHDFDSVRFDSISKMLFLIPKIKVRLFSIASSPSEQNHVIELCVALLKEQTPLGRSFHGLCSNYLAHLNVKDDVRMWIKPGSFHQLPMQLAMNGRFQLPVLFIGAGTGIAPLRGMIREREFIRKQNFISDNNHHDQILIFGCRKQTQDFLYQNEWDVFQKENRLKLLTAFSQDQNHKIYVQTLLDNNDIFVATHVLDKGGAIFIAGGKKMAKAVRDVIISILGRHLGGEVKAKTFLKRLGKRGLFRVEAW